MDCRKVLLSIRIPTTSCVVREVPFAGSVQELRSLVAKETSMDAETINLIYRGLIMRDGKEVSTYGLQSGEIVHVFAKIRSKIETEKIEITDEEAKEIATALKSAVAPLRSALSRLNKSDCLENVMAAIPGLKDDPIALSILRDPDLLIHMADPEVVKRINKSHPLVVEAAKHLAAELADQSKNDAGNNEEMETEEPPRQQRQITGNQLAAALASAISGVSRARQAPQRLFTSEMLNSALMQAFQSVPSSANSPAAPAAETAGPSTAPPPDRWTRQLQQMREVGLFDDNLNRQMLEITNGDVQAAIDLVMQSQQS